MTRILFSFRDCVRICRFWIYIVERNSDYYILILNMCLRVMCLRQTGESFKRLLITSGCSRDAADELWKWYDSAEKKGVASF